MAAQAGHVRRCAGGAAHQPSGPLAGKLAPQRTHFRVGPVEIASHAPDFAPARIVENRGRQIARQGEAQGGFGVEPGFKIGEIAFGEERLDDFGALQILAGDEDPQIAVVIARQIV